MTSYTWTAGTLANGWQSTVACAFFSLGDTDSGDRVLLDWDFRAAGYLRALQQNNGKVRLEGTFAGGADTLVSTATFPLSAWNWVFLWLYTPAATGIGLRCDLYSAGTLVESMVGSTVGISGPWTNALVSAALGVGQPVSFPAYAGFPNDPDHRWSKERVLYNAGAAIASTPPAVNPSGGLSDYLCTQPLGPGATVVDSGTNLLDLQQGPTGLTFNAHGPFIP